MYQMIYVFIHVLFGMSEMLYSGIVTVLKYSRLKACLNESTVFPPTYALSIHYFQTLMLFNKLNSFFSVWVPLPQVSILRACPNMSLAVEHECKILTWVDLGIIQHSHNLAYFVYL